MAGEGQNATRAGLADIFGVSLPTVDGWVRKGCPFIQRGGRGVEWQFSTAAVARWLRDSAVNAAIGGEANDLDEIEKRTASAKMQKAELELAKARGDVAPIREFERAQAKAFAEIRQNMMNVPQRVVTQLLGETDEIRFKQVLRAELTLALEAAANADLTLSEDDDDEQADAD